MLPYQDEIRVAPGAGGFGGGETGDAGARNNGRIKGKPILLISIIPTNSPIFPLLKYHVALQTSFPPIAHHSPHQHKKLPPTAQQINLISTPPNIIINGNHIPPTLLLHPRDLSRR
jgi:hypothetical protein